MPTMRKHKSIGVPVKAGEWVRIVTPRFFVRVGYPLDFEVETERVIAERGSMIRAFLKDQGITPANFPNADRPAFMKIARALAYDLCKQQSWGGKERTIYTIDLDHMAGRLTCIQGVRFVKTGTYATGSMNYDGEFDPPYLLDEKTHRILQTTLEGCIARVPSQADWISQLEIEAANVELLGD